MSKRKTVFVLMPFQKPYNDYYSHIFKPALESCGYNVSRADELYTNHPIMLDIQDSILKSDLILCDMSERNVNVFYELGLAHAIGKPVILVSRSEDDIPFDLQHIRTIIYDTKKVGWEHDLKESICKTVSLLVDPPNVWPPPIAVTNYTLSARNKDDIHCTPGIYIMEDRRWMTNDLKISLVETSSHIDMLGWNFNVTWFENNAVRLCFEKQLEKDPSDFQLRVLLPHNKSLTLESLLADREAFGVGQRKRYLNRYEEMIKYFKNWTSIYSRKICRFLQNEIVRYGILRFDEIMIVTHYLSSDRGSASPATILHNQLNITEIRMLYNRYLNDFNQLWERVK